MIERFESRVPSQLYVCVFCYSLWELLEMSMESGIPPNLFALDQDTLQPSLEQQATLCLPNPLLEAVSLWQWWSVPRRHVFC